MAHPPGPPTHRTRTADGSSFGFRLGPPACLVHPPDHPQGLKYPLFRGFDPPRGPKYPPISGFLGPFGPPPARPARHRPARSAVSVRAWSEIGGLDGDFWSENPVFDGGCHPGIAIFEPGSENWCYRSGFRDRKIDVWDTVSP